MDAHLLPWDQGPFVPQALSALDRLEASRSWASVRVGGVGLPWVLLGLAFLLAVAVAVGVAIYRRWARAKRRSEALDARAAEIGLNGPQRYVLAAIIRAAKLHSVEVAFTSQTAFERGASRLLRSRRVGAMDEQRTRDIHELIDTLREKLGFERVPPAAGPAPGADESKDELQIDQGDRLMVVYRGRPADFDVRVTEASPDELVVATANPLQCHPGETWLVRCTKAGRLWEFDTPVVRAEADTVTLRRSAKPRYINRRRFPRVRTRKPAHVTALPFWRAEMAPPEDVSAPGELVEIAGTGMRIQAPVSIPAGQRVLLAMKFGQGDIVEGVGRVRRVAGEDGEGASLVVELVGLDDGEIAKLMQETNAAAQANARKAAADRASAAEEND